MNKTKAGKVTDWLAPCSLLSTFTECVHDSHPSQQPRKLGSIILILWMRKLRLPMPKPPKLSSSRAWPVFLILQGCTNEFAFKDLNMKQTLSSLPLSLGGPLRADLKYPKTISGNTYCEGRREKQPKLCCVQILGTARPCVSL